MQSSKIDKEYNDINGLFAKNGIVLDHNDYISSNVHIRVINVDKHYMKKLSIVLTLNGGMMKKKCTQKCTGAHSIKVDLPNWDTKLRNIAIY